MKPGCINTSSTTTTLEEANDASAGLYFMRSATVTEDTTTTPTTVNMKYAIAPPPLIHVLKLTCSDDVARIFVTTDDAAYNSYCYYRKWVQYGPMEYTDFEIHLLRLFKIAA